MATLLPKLEVLQAQIEEAISEEDVLQRLSESKVLLADAFTFLKYTASGDIVLQVVDKLTDVLILASDTGQNAKMHTISLMLTECFKLVSSNTSLHICRMMIVKCFNTILEGISAQTKEEVLSEIDPKETIKCLYSSIFTAGDYELQVCTIECIFRLVPRKVLRGLFEDCPWGENFKNISGSNFEMDCRNFLNQVNTMNEGNSSRIHSVEAEFVKLDGEKVHKPSDQGYDNFWIDFNGGSKRISIFCEQTLLSSQATQTDDEMWETISVWAKDIKKYDVVASGPLHKVTIELVAGACLLSTKVSYSQAQAHLVIIAADQHYDLPGLMEEMTKAATVNARKASDAIEHIAISKVQTKDLPSQPPVRRKASLPTDQMMTPTSSIISESDATRTFYKPTGKQRNTVHSSQEVPGGNHPSGCQPNHPSGSQSSRHPPRSIASSLTSEEAVRAEVVAEQIGKKGKKCSQPLENAKKVQEKAKGDLNVKPPSIQNSSPIQEKAPNPVKSQVKPRPSTKCTDMRNQINDARASDACIDISQDTSLVQEGGDNNLSVRRSQRCSQKNQTAAKPMTLGDVIECSLEPQNLKLGDEVCRGEQQKKGKKRQATVTKNKEKSVDITCIDKPVQEISVVNTSEGGKTASPKRTVRPKQGTAKTPPAKSLKSQRKVKTPVVTVKPPAQKGLAKDEKKKDTSLDEKQGASTKVTQKSKGKTKCPSDSSSKEKDTSKPIGKDNICPPKEKVVESKIQEPTVSSLYEEQQCEKQQNRNEPQNLQEMLSSHSKHWSPGNMSVEDFKPEKPRKNTSKGKKVGSKKSQRKASSKTVPVEKGNKYGTKTDDSSNKEKNDCTKTDDLSTKEKTKQSLTKGKEDSEQEKPTEELSASKKRQNLSTIEEDSSNRAHDNEKTVDTNSSSKTIEAAEKQTCSDSIKAAEKQREEFCTNTCSTNITGAEKHSEEFCSDSDDLYIETEKHTEAHESQCDTIAETQYEKSAPFKWSQEERNKDPPLDGHNKEEHGQKKLKETEGMPKKDALCDLSSKSEKQIGLSGSGCKLNTSGNVQNSYVFGNIVSKKKPKNAEKSNVYSQSVNANKNSETLHQKKNAAPSCSQADQDNEVSSATKHYETSTSPKAFSWNMSNDELSPQVSSSSDICVDIEQSKHTQDVNHNATDKRNPTIKTKKPKMSKQTKELKNKPIAAAKRALRSRKKPVSYKEYETSFINTSSSSLDETCSQTKQKSCSKPVLDPKGKKKVDKTLGNRDFGKKRIDKTPGNRDFGLHDLTTPDTAHDMKNALLEVDKLGIYAPRKSLPKSDSRVSMWQAHRIERTVLTSFTSQPIGTDPYDFDADCQIESSKSRDSNSDTPLSSRSSEEGKRKKSGNKKDLSSSKSRYSQDVRSESFQAKVTEKKSQSSFNKLSQSQVSHSYKVEKRNLESKIKPFNFKTKSQMSESYKVEKRNSQSKTKPLNSKTRKMSSKMKNGSLSDHGSSDSSSKYALYASQLGTSERTSGLVFPPLEDSIPCTPYADCSNEDVDSVDDQHYDSVEDLADKSFDQKSVCSELSWLKRARKNKRETAEMAKLKGKTYDYTKPIISHQGRDSQDGMSDSDLDQMDLHEKSPDLLQSKENKHGHTPKTSARTSSARRMIFSPLEFAHTSKSPFSKDTPIIGKKQIKAQQKQKSPMPILTKSVTKPKNSATPKSAKSPMSILLKSGAKSRNSATPKSAKNLSFKSPEEEKSPSIDNEQSKSPSIDAEQSEEEDIAHDDESPPQKRLRENDYQYNEEATGSDVSTIQFKKFKSTTQSEHSWDTLSSQLSLRLKDLFGKHAEDDALSDIEQTPCKSGPSSHIRPSKSMLKRKYPFVSDSDINQETDISRTSTLSKMKSKTTAVKDLTEEKMSNGSRRTSSDKRKKSEEMIMSDVATTPKRNRKTSSNKKTASKKLLPALDASQDNKSKPGSTITSRDSFLSVLSCLSSPEKARSAYKRQRSVSDLSGILNSSSGEHLVLSPLASPQAAVLSQITPPTPNVELESPEAPDSGPVDLLSSVMKSIQQSKAYDTKLSRLGSHEDSDDDEEEEEPENNGMDTGIESLKEFLIQRQIVQKKSMYMEPHDEQDDGSDDEEARSFYYRRQARSSQNPGSSLQAVAPFEKLIEKMLCRQEKHESEWNKSKERIALVWMQQMQSLKQKRTEQQRELQKVKEALCSLESGLRDTQKEDEISQKTTKAVLKQDMDKFQRKLLLKYNDQSLEAMKRCLQASLMFS